MLNKNLKIAVLTGGPSEEHEVSLKSGKNVFDELTKNGYSTELIVLGKGLNLKSGDDSFQFPEYLKKFDIVFNALHGEFGEDGKIQKIFDETEIAYTGSGEKASAIGMDKWLSREIFKKNGLVVPESQLVNADDIHLDSEFPVVLKPKDGGSSFGVFIIENKTDLKEKTAEIFKRYKEAIIEEYLKGREFTCGVIEKQGEVFPLPIVEIRPKNKNGFFDYEAKYTTGMSEEIVPAEIDDNLRSLIQKAAITAHNAIGCEVYSRSDFILTDKELYILEINTLPGFTATSLIPQSALAAGIGKIELIEHIIEASFKKFLTTC